MRKAKKIKIIISIAAISFIQGLQYCVSPVLGQIQERYPKVDVSLIQMLITAPALLSMAVAVLSGWLVVKISKKKLLVFGSFVAGVMGFLPFLSDSFGLLFVSRTLYGVGLGLATALNTAVVAEFFEGDERVSVMGIQAASVGAGMVTVTTAAGFLGTGGYKNAYLINIIGFISMLLIFCCLPETGKAKVTNTEKIRMNRKVLQTAVLGMIEFLFLITFTTNIAMHLSGKLAGDTAVSGNLTGIFSGVQIAAGLIFRRVTKITKQYTLPVAMMSFSIGALLILLFPSEYILLIFGAAFCGFSQGIFIPQAMLDVAGAVKPVATAMASACFTCAICFGQVISPTVLNSVSKVIFGNVTTENVYKIAVVGMTAAAVITYIAKYHERKVKER